MELLHAEYFKMVAAGGDLDTAAERDLIQGENAAVELEGVQIEHLLSTSPNPNQIHQAGTKIKLRAVLAAATRDDMVNILGGSHTDGVFTLDQTPRNLGKFDVRFRIATINNGKFGLMDVTNCFVEPNWKGAFKHGARYYLPFDIKGADDSVFTYDGSNE